MAKIRAEFIKENIEVFDDFVSVGFLSLSIRQKFDIYNCWNTTEGTKMERYSYTADAMGVSESTVRNAVREMRKVV